MLENAIDAGANKISVKVLEGGSKLIIVSDNGTGIQKDELVLAIANHTTSKISTQEDLQNCDSHGFRGEALAAIASVANVKYALKYTIQRTGLNWSKLVETGTSSCRPAITALIFSLRTYFIMYQPEKGFSKTIQLSLSIVDPFLLS